MLIVCDSHMDTPCYNKLTVHTTLHLSIAHTQNTPAHTHTHTRLVTEEDDEESYEPRPEWAKAVPQRGMMRRDSEEGQLDTLSELHEDALTIYRDDIDDMAQIGEGV